MPEAISDSSTLIHLAGIGRLKLVKEFYEDILITPAFYIGYKNGWILTV